MKKIMLMVLTVLVLSGCAHKKEEASTTPTPSTSNNETTAPVASEVAVSTPEVAPQTSTTTPEETVTQAPIVQDDTKGSIVGNKITGKFSEEGEYGTSITFYEDGTFDCSINMCEGLVDISGTYTFDGTIITLDFPNKTDVHFIDERKEWAFRVNGTGFNLAEGEPAFSCLFVDRYYPQ